MKKSKAEAAQTRKRIIEVASEAFRSQGIQATGVAQIMASAGLTHGGFYRHFASKEELITEAIETSLEELVEAAEAASEQGAEAILKHFQAYVSTAYRDDVEHGCLMAANGSELVRTDETTRRVVSEGFQRIFESVVPFIRKKRGENPTDTAISVLTNMIGALTMSRVVDDPVLSERILEVTRRRIARSIEVPIMKPNKVAKDG